MQQKICVSCKCRFFADQPWKKICLSCWKISKGINNRKREPNFAWRPQPPQLIEEAMLKRLIYLCHPDKHNNSQAANLATDWLLKQRKQ
jgi:hypothetical protein